METTKLLQKDFLDILFEARNKDYGAYDHRVRYNRRVRNAVIGMSSVVLVIIGGYALGTLTAKDRETFIPPKIAELPEMQNLEIPEEKPTVIPPPAAATPPPAAAPTIDFAVPTVAPDDQVRPEDEIPDMDKLKGPVAIGVANIDGDPNGSDVGLPEGSTGSGVVEAPKVEVRNEPFITVEIMPEFPGGEKALMKFLQNNVNYPHMAAENGIEGTVFVKFVVQKDGVINMVETVGTKRGGGLEEEALRVVRKMPKWKPGRQNGENVPVYFNLPIRFTMVNQ